MATQRGIQIQDPEHAKIGLGLSYSKAPRRSHNCEICYCNTESNRLKWIDFSEEKGLLSSWDYVGIVEEVRSAVTNGLKNGARVAGMVHASLSLYVNI